MIKHYTPETYKKLSTFNLTKIIEQSYKNNIDISSILSFIDFTEKTMIEFTLIQNYTDIGNTNINYKIHETLADNIVSHLPYEYFKKIVTPDWCNEANTNLIHYAIQNENYEFIKDLLKISFDEYLKIYEEESKIKNSYMDKFRNYQNAFQKTLLQPIFNFHSYLYYNENSHDKHEKYIDLLKYTIPILNEVYYLSMRSSFLSTPSILDKYKNHFSIHNLTNKFESLERFLNLNSRIEDVYNDLLKTSNYQFFKIFSVNDDNLFKKEYIFKAIYNDNINIFNEYIQKNNLSKNEIFSFFNDYLEMYKVSSNFLNYLKTTFEFTSDDVKNENLKFLFLSNKESIEYSLLNFPKLKKIAIYDDYTLDDFLNASHYIDRFYIAYSNITKNKTYVKENKFLEHLQKELPKQKKKNFELTNNASKLISIYFDEQFGKSHIATDLKTKLNHFLLEEKIEDKEESVKTKKNKI